MPVLSPDFLNPLEIAGIPIINLHPALPGAFNGAVSLFFSLFHLSLQEQSVRSLKSANSRAMIERYRTRAQRLA